MSLSLGRWISGVPQAPGWYWLKTDTTEFVGEVYTNKYGSLLVNDQGEPTYVNGMLSWIEYFCPVEKPAALHTPKTDKTWAVKSDHLGYFLERTINDRVYVIYWSRPGVAHWSCGWKDPKYKSVRVESSRNNYKSFDSAKRAILKKESGKI